MMRPFERFEAIAAPLPLANVDTDKIIPSRYLKTVSRSGLGKMLFASLRADPNFVLNRAPWDRAGILIALENFGCGSSREHAPWALLDFGIRCIIAPSFADIFYSNCFKNGILAIVLDEQRIGQLMMRAGDPSTAMMTVDLQLQTLKHADAITAFDVDPKRRTDLLFGVDEIARSMSYENAIAQWEAKRAVGDGAFELIDQSKLAAMSVVEADIDAQKPKKLTHLSAKSSAASAAFCERSIETPPAPV